MNNSSFTLVAGMFAGAFIVWTIMMLFDVEDTSPTYGGYISTKEAAKHECGEFDRLTGEFIWRKK